MASDRRWRRYVVYSLTCEGRRNSVFGSGNVLFVVHRRLRRPWRGGRSCRCGTWRIDMSIFPGIGEGRRRIKARTRRRGGRLLGRRRLALYSL